MLKNGIKIKIKEGFYKGCKGIVVDSLTCQSYRVKIIVSITVREDNTEIIKWKIASIKRDFLKCIV